MGTVVTGKLDKTRAKKLGQWARKEGKTKSDVLRELIDERQKIETGEDLTAFVEELGAGDLGASAVDNRPPLLLDSSFLIALERETRTRRAGPAVAMLPQLQGGKLCLSVVTVEGFLEGAAEPDAAARALARFAVHPIAWAHARRCALLQSRAGQRLGENDAWIFATAEMLAAEIVRRDRPAFPGWVRVI